MNVKQITKNPNQYEVSDTVPYFFYELVSKALSGDILNLGQTGFAYEPHAQVSIFFAVTEPQLKAYKELKASHGLSVDDEVS